MVVASTEIAYQVLRGLGEDHQWASYATSGMVPGYDAEMFQMQDIGDI